MPDGSRVAGGGHTLEACEAGDAIGALCGELVAEAGRRLGVVMGQVTAGDDSVLELDPVGVPLRDLGC